MRPHSVTFLLSTVLLASGQPEERKQAKGGNALAAEGAVRAADAVAGAAASNLKSLMQSAEVENEYCRGGHGDDTETMHACNRRQKLLVELERRGWCFEETGENRWLKCARDPAYQPGQYGSEPPYSDAEIREASEGRIARDAGAPVKLYEEVQRLNAACVSAGGGVSGSPDCDAATVKEVQLERLGYCIDYSNNEKLARCDEVGRRPVKH